MANLTGKGNLKEASIHAVVIRADGTTEDLGIVSYWTRNPFKLLAYKIKLWRPS